MYKLCPVKDWCQIQTVFTHAFCWLELRLLSGKVYCKPTQYYSDRSPLSTKVTFIS